MTSLYKERKIRRMRKEGYSYTEIVKIVKVSRRDITKIAKFTKFSKEGKKRYFKEITGVVKPIKKQKKELTLGKTRIIGNLLFDGSVCKIKKYNYVIAYVNSSEKLAKNFARDLKEVYGIKPYEYAEKGKTKIYRVICKSKNVYLDLLKYIKSYSTSNKLAKIPEEIMNGSKRVKLEFLRTFWDNEGSISKTCRLRGCSNSLKIINQLYKLHKDLKFEIEIYKDLHCYNPSYILSLRKNTKNLNLFYKYKLFTDSKVAHGYNYGKRKIDVVKAFINKK